MASQQKIIEFRKTRTTNIKEEKHGAIKTKEAYLQEKDSKLEQREKIREKELKILKEFDLNVRYGPCVGISRIKRWERAEAFGLTPPNNIKEILLSHQMDSEYTESLWRNEKGLVP